MPSQEDPSNGRMANFKYTNRLDVSTNKTILLFMFNIKYST